MTGIVGFREFQEGHVCSSTHIYSPEFLILPNDVFGDFVITQLLQVSASEWTLRSLQALIF